MYTPEGIKRADLHNQNFHIEVIKWQTQKSQVPGRDLGVPAPAATWIANKNYLFSQTEVTPSQ